MTLTRSLLPSFSREGKPAIKRFRDEIDELFDNFVDNFFGEDWKLSLFDDLQPKVHFPKIDVSEDDKEYCVDIAIAGFNKDDVKLKLEDDALLIEADKHKKGEREGKNYLRKEISRKSFKRVVKFPEKILCDSAEASYDNGVISFKVNKDLSVDEDKSILIDIK